MIRPPPPWWLRAWPILAGLAAVALAMSWAENRPAGLMIVVSGEPTFRCGTTPRGEYGRHRWEIRNVGRVPLLLRTRFTSGRCGFSLWQGQEHTILPGAHLAVFLTWPTPQDEANPYSAHAEIHTNDPQMPRFRLHIVGMTGPAPLSRVSTLPVP